MKSQTKELYSEIKKIINSKAKGTHSYYGMNEKLIDLFLPSIKNFVKSKSKKFIKEILSDRHFNNLPMHSYYGNSEQRNERVILNIFSDYLSMKSEFRDFVMKKGGGFFIHCTLMGQYVPSPKDYKRMVHSKDRRVSRVGIKNASVTYLKKIYEDNNGEIYKKLSKRNREYVDVRLGRSKTFDENFDLNYWLDFRNQNPIHISKKNYMKVVESYIQHRDDIAESIKGNQYYRNWQYSTVERKLMFALSHMSSEEISVYVPIIPKSNAKFLDI